ncbi:MAG TPA: hypothetical protein O0X32_03815 [Methanocorpusculum sp.]|nr:hypothetical protein [Methanocorpusculum sp.]
MIEQLDSIEYAIDDKMEQLIPTGQMVFSDGIEAELLIAFIYSPLISIELSEVCGKLLPEVTMELHSLSTKGYVESNSGRYALKDAEKS